MNEKEYLQELNRYLQHIPQAEKDDALEYVQEYLEEARSQEDSAFLQSLPSPEEFARRLLEDLENDSSSDFRKHIFSSQPGEDRPPISQTRMSDQQKFPQMDSSFSIFSGPGKVLAMFLAVLFSPALLGLILCAAMFGLLLIFAAALLFVAALLVGMMGVILVLACAISIPVLVCKSILLVPSDFLGIVFNAGLCLILLALGVIASQLTKLYFLHFIPWCFEMLKRFTLALLSIPEKLARSLMTSTSKKGCWTVSISQNS